MSTFDIESIRVENFKSFKGKHDFVFPDEEGFYSIAGKNEVQPRLGPNGAGKTSFIDALFWCLYGKTPAGLKASDVCSWGVKGRCRVSSRIVVADNGLVVTRTQSPNSLTVSINDGSPTPIEQDKLNELLRLTDEEFPFAVMIPQSGEDMFFDLKPNRKLALFSKVLKLDFWLDKSVVAQRDAEKILARIREKNTKLSHNNGQIESLEDTLDILREKSEQFEEDRKSKLAELRTVSKEVARSLETGEEKLGKLQSDRDYLKDEGKINSEQRSVIDKEIDELKDKRSSLQTEEGVLSQSISKMEAEARRLFNIGGQCPVCRQKVTKLHIKNTTGDLRTSIKKSSALLNDLQVSISSLTKAINKKKDSVMVLAQEHTRIAEKYQATVSKLSDLKSAIASTTAESNSLIKEINSLKNGQNPHKETIRESKDRIERLKDEIHKLKGEMSTLEEAHEIASFWVNGFKKVRLLVIEDTLQQLEVETNNNLVQLGLIGWSVRFDIERENKSGGLTSGFTVMINSPEYNEPVKWEAWSGGEKQRLRLAGALGLSNLIMDRAGLTSRIEFYDELSRHLSPEGIDDMLDTLCQRASDFGRKIWLVDHQSHDFGDFAGKLTITKTDAGSQLHFECGQQ